jgi:hypothetical protein
MLNVWFWCHGVSDGWPYIIHQVCGLCLVPCYNIELNSGTVNLLDIWYYCLCCTLICCKTSAYLEHHKHLKTWAYVHVGGIQTCDHSVWAVKDDTCPRMYSQWDKLMFIMKQKLLLAYIYLGYLHFWIHSLLHLLYIVGPTASRSSVAGWESHALSSIC